MAGRPITRDPARPRDPVRIEVSGPESFERRASEVIGRVRRLIAETIETAMGGGSTASEVADHFQIHRKLGWQITHVAYDDDPFLAARFMPTRRGMQTWLDAAARQGVADDHLEELAGAVDDFEALIDEHAPNRDVLKMMLESCASRTDEAADQHWRESAFNGNSYIWGVRVRAQLCTSFLAPSQDRSGWFDMARINALLGFVRTRPNVRWVIGQTVSYGGEDDAVLEQHRAPLFPELQPADCDVPIIEAYSSTPLPKIIRRDGPHGLLEDELQPGEVGSGGQVDIVLGEITRALAPACQTYEGEDALFGIGVRVPAEVLVCDHIVHRDLFPAAQYALRVYSELFSPVARDDRDQLVVSDDIQHLGRGLNRLQTPDVPHYASMAQHVFDQLGWNAGDFLVYRVRMAYPPMPASVMFHHELPPPESAGG